MKMQPIARGRRGRPADPPEIRALKIAARNKRPNAKYRKKAEPAPPQDCSGYPPGHFLELVRRHNWPPMFQPSSLIVSAVQAGGMTPSEKATLYRQIGLEQGRWHALGTVPMAGTPKDSGPLGWM